MQRVIFDCDNTLGLPTKEIDDGLALFYLLGSPEIELLGVTTTFGNGSIDQVYSQTQKLTASLGREELTVKKGAGARGEGSTAASRFLVEMASAYPGEVVLLATGPLGNLRAAQEIDPAFVSKLKAIACMGGYLGPVTIGRRQVSELNLSADPEAAFQVLNARCPVTLMTAQICLQAPFAWRDLPKLKFWSRKTRSYVRNWLLLHGIFCGIGHFYLWDLLPAVFISYPELFNHNPVFLRSSVEDLETGTLIPETSSTGGGINMPALILDPDRFRDILFKSWRAVDI
jgi:purine nucleosidase